MPKPLVQSTGRRKSAVARVRLRPGDGKVTINRRALTEYFPSSTYQVHATEALRVAGKADVYDIDATIDGGGVSGQAGALRLGIARGLIELDPELRTQLKRAGLLTRDPRRGRNHRRSTASKRPARLPSVLQALGLSR